jgi:branched-chain amino acid transport system substrate-binding protein
VTTTRRRFLLGLAAVPLLGACASGAERPAPGEAIRIVGLFALTGDDATLDRPAADGARLAVNEINAAGGVLGRRLELIVRDTQTALDATARVARRSVAEDRPVAVIGFTNTDPLLAAAPPIRDAGLVLLTPGATSPRIPAQVGPRAFLVCFGDNAQAAAGAEFAAARFGKRGYLLRSMGVEYTKLLAGYFKARFLALGGTLAFEDKFEDKNPDLSAQIARLRRVSPPPDFYYVAAMAYDIGPILTQLRAAGLTGPVVGGDSYDAPELLAVGGRAADNVFFTTHALMEGEGVTPRVRDFAAAYRAAYGRAPESAFAALGHDTVRLLADAIRRAGTTQASAIQRALEATRGFAGITGTIGFSAASHVPEKAVTVIAVRNGKLTLGAEIVPQAVPLP